MDDGVAPLCTDNRAMLADWRDDDRALYWVKSHTSVISKCMVMRTLRRKESKEMVANLG